MLYNDIRRRRAQLMLTVGAIGLSVAMPSLAAA